MTSLCINCSSKTSLDSDFCDECLVLMESGVEANIRRKNLDLVDTNKNVLFQTSTLTGDILESDDDRIGSRLRDDDEGGYSYGTYVIMLVFLLALFIAVYT